MDIIIALISFIVGIVIGGGLIYAVFQKQISVLNTANVSLTDSFKALSSDALRENNATFLQLAGAELGPVKQHMEQYKTALETMERERAEQFASLNKYIDSVIKADNDLREETSKLSTALRSPLHSGRWGETQLRRVAELAGMMEHCDFDVQVTFEGANRTQRLDMVVYLPDGRQMIVDAKAPMSSYLDAMEEVQDSRKIAHLKEHAKKVRGHAKNLSSREYWRTQPNTPAMTILFLPGEPYLSAAMKYDADLFADCARDKIILATPSNLLALLFAASHGWHQAVIEKDAERISELGSQLYDDLYIFTASLKEVGIHLGKAVRSYNSAVNNFESNVVSSAGELKTLGTGSTNTITRVPQVSRSVKIPTPEFIVAPVDEF